MYKKLIKNIFRISVILAFILFILSLIISWSASVDYKQMNKIKKARELYEQEHSNLQNTNE